MTRRGAYLGVALILLLIAVTLPTAWYDSIPREPGFPPLPFRGVTLLRFTFLFEALVFGALAARDWSFVSGSGDALPTRPERAEDLSPATAMALLAAITVLAVVLRTISLRSDLWIDEITTIVDYRDMPSLQVIGSYLRSNNHLLNTLLMKGAIAAFGEYEWSARLPAMLFGVATIPMIYWVARLAMSRLASLGAALLLALSYHHIFFSQNARGYTAYLFFALVSTGALARGLRRDELRQWVLYTVSVVLGFASLVTFGFVFAAQVLTGAIAVFLGRRQKAPAGPLVRRLVTVYAIAGFLSFQLYAASLPEAYVVITNLYSVHGTTYAAFSTDFVRDAFRGLSAGFRGGAATVLFLVVAALGFASLAAASWPVAATLALTLLLTAGILVARGLTFSPRFFFIGLSVAILSAMSASEWLADAVRRRFFAGRLGGRLILITVMAVISGVFALSLPRYYRTPKQPYRAAISYVESSLRPADEVAVIYVAESGFRYYVARQSVRDSNAYHYVRTTVALDSLLRASPRGHLLVVTTLPGILKQYIPDLSNRIADCCEVAHVFPGTLGDGDITVWRERRAQ